MGVSSEIEQDSIWLLPIQGASFNGKQWLKHHEVYYHL